jgi:hypothetical protein
VAQAAARDTHAAALHDTDENGRAKDASFIAISIVRTANKIISLQISRDKAAFRRAAKRGCAMRRCSRPGAVNHFL